MASGVYPLGIKRLNLPRNDYDTNIRKAVNRLVKFDKKVFGVPKKNKKRKLLKNASEDGKQKKRKYNNGAAEPEYVFERNSGTWYVFDISEGLDGGKKGHYSDAVNELENSHQQNGSKYFDDKIEDQLIDETTYKRKKTTDCSQKCGSRVRNNHVRVPKNASPSSENKSQSPVKLFENSSTETSKELFPKSEWDESLQDGEYEICIPSRKYIDRMKKQSRNKQINHNKLLVNNTLKIIKAKNRLSLGCRLVQNPFANSTPNSIKRVKINTKLNRSQEIDEHFAGILKSPAIPYDANKKPDKPLLKRNSLSSPVNPFYKQLEI